jgi:L-threonylcarbamoyladenylate synthase
MISIAQLEEVIGSVERAEDDPAGDAARMSPGQLERHYAPRAALELLTARELARRLESVGDDERVGAIVLSPVTMKAWVQLRHMPQDPAGYASALYAELHLLDDMNCTTILLERPPDRPEWAAVHDRLRRAAHT